MPKVFNTRIKLKIDNENNWTQNNPVLLHGEEIIIETESGELRRKIGDGSTPYSQLLFLCENIRQLLNNKADKTVATMDKNGLMSATDKIKLDALELGEGNTIIIDQKIEAHDVILDPTRQFVTEEEKTQISNIADILQRLTELEQNKLEFPIGYIMISVSDVNPGTFTSGIWELFGSGRTLMGFDGTQTEFDQIEKTGGTIGYQMNLNHTHNIPAHTHAVDAHTHTTADHTLTIEELPAHGKELTITTLDSYTGNKTPNIKHFGQITETTGPGGDQPHNHGDTGEASPGTSSVTLSTAPLSIPVDINVLNPYITVYMWKRIA